MLKTLGRYVGQFKRDSMLTPVFMLLEVLMETVLPLIMASIIDKGITKGDINHIYLMGGLMLLTALVSLFAGIMGGRFGASASTGFGRNLRKAMFENIQTFSFSNIDTYSTSSLVTRLTTDVTNIQNSYQMILRMGIRGPFSLAISMCMAFVINARLATIYLVAAIFLGFVLVTIATKTMKYFRQVFEKYDEMNRSVQENVSAIRVVKA
ncbi:MAG: ABC transporter ATP-binding protein, partial [Firmicutes bacterium]|nr:ABC transporter ATP-binding protein [Bacillota bacterium]